MSNLHELALFWRDQQARCVTLLHFSPQRQAAPARAKKIATTLQSLSTLQLYGAALDGESLEVSGNDAAPEAGTERRLEIELYPAKKVNARMSITYMRVTVPAPVPALAAAVSKGRFQAPEWQLLDSEVFPFLKLPVGVGVTAKTGKARVFKALLLELKEERRPLPGQSPLAAKLNDARKRFDESKQLEAQRRTQGDYTPRDSERVQKFAEQVRRFERLAALEEHLFAGLLSQPHSARPQALTAAAAPSSAGIEEVSIPMAQPKSTPTAPAPLPAETMEMAAAPATDLPVDYHFLPVPPTPGSAEAQHWQDVPTEHFSDPQYWTNVFLVKAESGISQRTYFRLLDKLKENGLSRSLPADVKRKGVLPLYYRPDWDQALKSAGESKPQRGRTARTLTSVAISSQQPEAAEPTLATARHTGKDSAGATLPALSAINDSLEKLTKTITDFQERFQSEISSLHAQVQSLSQRQDQLDSSLAKGIGSLPAVDALSQLLSSLAAATSATALNKPTNAGLAGAATSSKFLTVSQAAQLINKDSSTVRRACERKFYKVKKVNGSWQIDREDFYRKHNLN
jgi:hypothetical protein